MCNCVVLMLIYDTVVSCDGPVAKRHSYSVSMQFTMSFSSDQLLWKQHVMYFVLLHV